MQPCSDHSMGGGGRLAGGGCLPRNCAGVATFRVKPAAGGAVCHVGPCPCTRTWRVPVPGSAAASATAVTEGLLHQDAPSSRSTIHQQCELAIAKGLLPLPFRLHTSNRHGLQLVGHWCLMKCSASLIHPLLILRTPLLSPPYPRDCTEWPSLHHSTTSPSCTLTPSLVPSSGFETFHHRRSATVFRLKSFTQLMPTVPDAAFMTITASSLSNILSLSIGPFLHQLGHL